MRLSDDREQHPESAGVFENPILGEAGYCCWGLAFFLRTEYHSGLEDKGPLAGMVRGAGQCVKRPQALSDVCVESATGKRVPAGSTSDSLPWPAEVAGPSHSAGTVGTMRQGKPGWRALGRCWNPLCLFKSVLRGPSSPFHCHTLSQQLRSVSTRSHALSSIFSAIQ